MTDFNFKTANPDTSLPSNGFLLGADSQSAVSPSMLTVDAVRQGLATSQSVATMAALRALSVTVERTINLQGFYLPGDGGGGQFYGAQQATFTATTTGLGLYRTLKVNSVLTGIIYAGMQIYVSGALFGTILGSDISTATTVNYIIQLQNSGSANLVASGNPSVSPTVTGKFIDDGGIIIIPTGGDGSLAWVRVTEGSDTVNVMWYGAVGDGVADDTAAIQAAVNASPAVEISAGKTFRVTSAITVPDDVYLFGPGEIFVDQSPYYLNCFRVGSGVTIDGITFRGANNPAEISPTIPGGSNSLGKAVNGHLANNVTVKNCTFYNFRDWGHNVNSGIIRFSSCHNIKILDNYFEDSNYGQFDIDVGYRVGDVLVDGNTSYSNSDGFLSIATLNDDISSTIKFKNSANHIVTNNTMIKARWNVPLVPVSNASFTATIVSTGVRAVMTVSGPVTGTITPLQMVQAANIPWLTLIQSPGAAANTWELLNPAGLAIPNISTPTALTSAVGATFTGTIANKVLTTSGLTGMLNESQWLFCTDPNPALALPAGTKISSSTADFTGSVSGTTLTITAITGALLANNTETLYGLGIPTGTTVVSQITPLNANEAIGGVGRYTISAPLGTLTSRNIWVDNRWNILSDDPTLSRTSVAMTSQQTNLGRHGIVAHYDTGESYLNANGNFIGNVARHGIYLRGSTTKAYDTVGPDNVSNNYFVYCGNGPFDVSSYASGIRAESSLPTTCIGNYFYKTGYYPNGTPGIQAAQDIECSRGPSDVNIAYNTCIGAKDGAIFIDASIPNSSVTNIKIIGNTIQNAKFGISYGASAVATTLTDDIQILDNNIVLTGADYSPSPALAAPRSAGIWADVSALVYKYSLRISGNTVVGAGLSASFTGTIAAQKLTASSITGAIASGQKLSWQTASFTASISNGLGGAGNILDVTAVTGTILANGTEVVVGSGVTTGAKILSQLSGATPGGVGTYQLSITNTVTTAAGVLNIPSRPMTSRIVEATVVSPMATFVGFISDTAGTAAGTTLFVTEMGSGTIVPSDNPAITGFGATITPGTTITTQLTSTEPGGILGGRGTYTVSGAPQLVTSNRISVTNIWNLSNSYSATGVAMTSGSNAYGIALPFGSDNFAGTALVDDNTFRGLLWGLASVRFAGNTFSFLLHKKLGFEVVWDRNRFVSCDNAMLVAKNSAAHLSIIGPSNVFDGCTNTNILNVITWETAVRGRSLGQGLTSGASFTGEWMASAAPTSEAYIAGDRVLNSSVAAGGNVGWICTTAGSPGTWQRFGQVELAGSATYDPPPLPEYTFTVAAANPITTDPVAGAVYRNDVYDYEVTAVSLTGTAGVNRAGTIRAKVSGKPPISGTTLTKQSGTGDATITFASATSATTTTVTVTGAALGDYVTGISFSNNLQGIDLTGWVSATNTVTVKFNNDTDGAAPIDLGSGTLRVNVMKQ